MTLSEAARAGRSVRQLKATILSVLAIVAPHAMDAAPEGQSLFAKRDATETPLMQAHTAPRLKLDLNIPSFQLVAVVDDSTWRRFRVAVGAPAFPTPTGDFLITSVEWNPWWVPPDREWARGEQPHPPGWSNPMGRARFLFRPLYFIHGSSHENELGSAASHGCIRVSNADVITLARKAVELGVSTRNQVPLDSLMADTALTRAIPLDIPVWLRIRYEVAEVRADTVYLYRDVYRVDPRSETQRVIDALVRAGVPARLVDSVEVRTRLRRTRQRPAHIPVAAVIDTARATQDDHR